MYVKERPPGQDGRRRWLLRWELPRDPQTGHRRRVHEVFAGGKRGAERRWLRRQAEIEVGADPGRRSSRTLGSYLDDWIAAHEVGLRPKTVDLYRGVLTRHIIPSLGHVRLDRLTTDSVQSLIDGLARAGHVRTANVVRMVLREALSRAVDVGLMGGDNPAARTRAARERREGVRHLTPDELAAVTTTQARRAIPFPSSGTAQRALRRLWEARRISRHRSTAPGGEWIWTPRRVPGDIPHRLAIADCYIALGCPRDFHPEFRIGLIRADALFWLDGRPWWLEVERSHNDLADKMRRYLLTAAGLEWRDLWRTFPRLLLVVGSPAKVASAESIPSPPKTVSTISMIREDVMDHVDTVGRGSSRLDLGGGAG